MRASGTTNMPLLRSFGQKRRGHHVQGPPPRFSVSEKEETAETFLTRGAGTTRRGRRGQRSEVRGRRSEVGGQRSNLWSKPLSEGRFAGGSRSVRNDGHYLPGHDFESAFHPRTSAAKKPRLEAGKTLALMDRPGSRFRFQQSAHPCTWEDAPHPALSPEDGGEGISFCTEYPGWRTLIEEERLKRPYPGLISFDPVGVREAIGRRICWPLG